MSIFTDLETIKTALEAITNNGSALFKRVDIGTDFEINAKQMPHAIIHITGGDINNIRVIYSTSLHIVGLFYRETEENILKVVSDGLTLVKNDTGLIALRHWLTGPIHFRIDSDILDIFNLEFIPILSPFGGFRLDYKLASTY